LTSWKSGHLMDTPKAGNLMPDSLLRIQIILMWIGIRPLKKPDADPDPIMLNIKFCNKIVLLKNGLYDLFIN
jgi:hypothetical protein